MKFILAVVLALVLFVPKAAASLRPLEQEFADRTNNVRQRRDVRRLQVGSRLQKFARHAARKMARQQELVHSKFTSAHLWGENIGKGRSVRQVFRAMMKSRDHRRNILRKEFRKVGVGIVKGARGIWVVQIFTGRRPRTTSDWVAAAKAEVGTPYSWGGSTVDGFDCSGFTAWVVENATGRALPHSSEGQRRALPSVSREGLESGDLLFYHYSDRNGTGASDHVEVYLGGNEAIGTEDGGVAVQDVDWPALIGAGSTGIETSSAPESYPTSPIRASMKEPHR